MDEEVEIHSHSGDVHYAPSSFSVATRSDDSDNWSFFRHPYTTMKRVTKQYSVNNEIVIITTVFVVGVFLVTVIVVVLMKKYRSKKQKQLLVIKQTGRNYRARHPYLVSVITGSRLGAGTDGFVHMKLHGKQEISDEFYLNPFLHDPERHTFERTRVSRFVFFAKENLGDLYLTELELQSESPTSWFLCYVVVQDVTTLQQWYFPHHGWLKASGGLDCKIDLLAGVLSNWRLLKDNLFKGFRKHHIWYKLVSHLSRSTQFNTILSLGYCTSLVLCFMFANSVLAGIVQYNGIFVPFQFYGVSIGTDTCVALIAALQEIVLIMIENRNRFDDLENRGTLCLNSALAKGFNLKSLDTSVWKDNLDFPQNYKYFGMNGFGNDDNNNEFYAVGESYNHTNMNEMKGLTVYGRGDQQLSNNQVKHNNVQIVKDKNDVAHTINMGDNSLWIPGGKQVPLHTSVNELKNDDDHYARDLAQATNAQYQTSHTGDMSIMPLGKSLSWFNEAEMYFYEKNRPVSMGSSLYRKALVPIRDQRKVPGLMPAPRSKTGLSRRISDGGGGTTGKNGGKNFIKDHQKYGVQKRSTDNIIDYTYNKSDKFNDLHHSLGARIKELDESGNNDKQLNADAPVKSQDAKKEMQGLVLNRLQGCVPNEQTAAIKPQQHEQQMARKESLKEAIHPLVTSFVEDVKKSVVENKDIDSSDLKKLESELVCILQHKYSREGKLGIDQQEQRQHPLEKVSSLTEYYSDKLNRKNRHSDTSLDAALKDKHSGLSSQDNVNSDTVCAEKTYLLQSKNSPYVLEGSTAAKKLSDAVIGCASTKNNERVEKTADVILNSSKRSRELLLSTLCKTLEIDGDLEKELLKKVSDKNFAAAAALKKRSSQLLEDKVPASVIPKIKKDHVSKTANASLQTVLSDETRTKFEDIVNNYGKSEMNAFATDVVEGLYIVVRKKLETMIALDMKIDEHPGENEQHAVEAWIGNNSGKSGSDNNDNPHAKWKQFQAVLTEADTEIKTEILPVITEHIVNLIEEEAHTLETLDIDLMMMAFGGQFVDTVVTNAVLQTHVGVVKYCRELHEQKHKSEEDKTKDLTKGVKDKWQHYHHEVESNEKPEDIINNKDEPVVDDNNNKSASNANKRSTEQLPLSEKFCNTKSVKCNSDPNILTAFSDVLHSNFNDLKTMINEQVVTRVLKLIHEKLGHKSKLELEPYVEDGKICCSLCKPKVIKEIVEKIPGMSAARFITEEVLNKALSELEKLQELELQMIQDPLKDDDEVVDKLQKKNCSDSLKSRLSSHTMFRTIGEMIALKNKLPENNISDKYYQLIEDIVTDLTEYIMATSCDYVAMQMIGLMDKECAVVKNTEKNEEDLGDIKQAVQKKVRGILKDRKVKEDDRTKYNSNNNNEANRQNGERKQSRETYRDYGKLSPELAEVKTQVEKSNAAEVAADRNLQSKSYHAPSPVGKQLDNIHQKYSTSVPNMVRFNSPPAPPVKGNGSRSPLPPLNEKQRTILRNIHKTPADEDTGSNSTNSDDILIKHTIMNSITTQQTTYHTYHYDDSAKFQAGMHSCLFQFVYVLFFLITVLTFVGTLIIGMGLTQVMATHWLICVLLAVALHITVFESVKIFILAMIATYGGHQLL